MVSNAAVPRLFKTVAGKAAVTVAVLYCRVADHYCKSGLVASLAVYKCF